MLVQTPTDRGAIGFAPAYVLGRSAFFLFSPLNVHILVLGDFGTAVGANGEEEGLRQVAVGIADTKAEHQFSVLYAKKTETVQDAVLEEIGRQFVAESLLGKLFAVKGRAATLDVQLVKCVHIIIAILVTHAAQGINGLAVKGVDIGAVSHLHRIGKMVFGKAVDGGTGLFFLWCLGHHGLFLFFAARGRQQGQCTYCQYLFCLHRFLF